MRTIATIALAALIVCAAPPGRSGTAGLLASPMPQSAPTDRLPCSTYPTYLPYSYAWGGINTGNGAIIRI